MSKPVYPKNAVAIVGMGCRFPGAKDINSFWEILREGRDTISKFPDSRSDLGKYYDPDFGAKGKMYSNLGGFLSEIEYFDAEFFSLSRLQAALLDPQQRLLLEVSWEALEMAGYVPSELIGTRTGVFMGIGSQDYALSELIDDIEQLDCLNSYFIVSNDISIAVNRLSCFYGFTGPSFAINATCASSMVAINIACQQLSSKQINMALVGGVNYIGAPYNSIALSQAWLLSPSGHCRSFDVNADGYVRGEGCGIIVLKRLEDAIKAKDNVLAVILGSSVNHDGKRSDLVVPNYAGRLNVIVDALREAKCQATDISYVEAHGFGTPTSDIVELQVLQELFGDSKKRKGEPCYVGTVKTNIGYLEYAAGIASVIKVVLALQNKIVPAHLHLDKIHPGAEVGADSSLIIPNKNYQWNIRKKQKRRAGVNAFSMGGTNAHVIIEEAPIQPKNSIKDVFPALFIFSAKTVTALNDYAKEFHDYLVSKPEESLNQFFYTIACGKTHFPYKTALVVKDRAELLKKLQEQNYPQSETKTEDINQIVFLFTGQGSQYINMGKELYQTEPVFRDCINQCNKLLLKEFHIPLKATLFPNKGKSVKVEKNFSAYAQPILFSFEYALAQLWLSWGIVPSLVIGHSLGEYTAACIAGVINLPDALRLVAIRGKLMQAVPEAGEMLAVFSDSLTVKNLIKRTHVTIANYNSDNQIVISGDIPELNIINEKCSRLGIETRFLNVKHAFHTKKLLPAAKKFFNFAKKISYHEPKFPIITNLTGDIAKKKNFINAEYWKKHIFSPVLFSQSIKVAFKEGYRHFIEIGPRPILLTLARMSVEEDDNCLWLASINKPENTRQQILQSLGTLYRHGYTINWNKFYSKQTTYPKLITPTYPFQKKYYWYRAMNAGSKNPAIEKPLNLNPWHEELRKLNDNERYDLILNYLGNLLSDVLKVSAINIPPDSLLCTFGLDSLTAIGLKSKLEQDFDVRISGALFDKACKVSSLAKQLADHMIRKNKDSLFQVEVQSVDLVKEAEISPFSVPTKKAPKKAQNIFITGATGFLGAFLLAEILSSTTANVFCLVRAETQEEGTARLIDNLKKYLLFQEVFTLRIKAIVGDLAKPDFGLSESQFSELAKNIDTIYHNGAIINWSASYNALKATNIEGTKTVIKLAASNHIKKIYYVSSICVLFPIDFSTQEKLLETENIEQYKNHAIGYFQSKWVAEKIILQARAIGLPIAIYRPAFITGDSRTGICNLNDFIPNFIKGCVTLGAFPYRETSLDMVPVDFLAKFIIKSSLHPESINKIFNLSNPERLSFKDLFSAVKKNYPIIMKPYNEWVCSLATLEKTNVLNNLMALFSEIPANSTKSLFEIYSSPLPVIDCPNTLAMLKKISIQFPVIDEKLISLYLNYIMPGMEKL